ncbi:hypothetical protein JCM33374_g1148 [Metschnikowia sp. JCM 33374]|nr:hypothetical protein JCM33374_g1148 [Metschnikowia sp. JCM 33374]
MQQTSIPKHFRGEQSPVISMDSPFPPLKTEHRYRGVYERAGFDVNLRSSSSSDDRASFFRNSPSSPALSGKNAFFTHNNNKSGSREFSPLSSQHPSISRPSFNSQQKSSPASFNETQPSYVSHFKGTERSTAHSSPLTSSVSLPQHQVPSSASLPITSIPSARPVIKPFRPEQVNARLASASSSREQLQSDASDRNKKQLKLHIPESESAFHTSAETSADAFERDSPFDKTHGRKRSTPITSASSSENFTNKTHSSSPTSSCWFEDGYQSTQKFEPRGANSNPSSQKQSAAPGAFVPATRNLSDSFNKDESEDSVDTVQDNVSFRFNTTGQSSDTADTSRDEFEQVSRYAVQNIKPYPRNSQFSTISSIISKHRESRFAHGLEGDEDEDEVELELQKQLDEIKKGSQLSLVSPGVINSQDSFVTAANSLNSEASVVPTFKISDEHDEEKQERELDTDEETEINDTNTTTTISAPHPEAEKHLNNNEKKPALANEPFTPSMKESHFDDEPMYNTPETIKPLSPKTHFVEKELESLNFKYQQETESQDRVQSVVSSEQSDTDILGKNPTPSEFDAFPKSVIDPGFTFFKDTETSRKCLPGTGPCRSCGLSIKPNARGHHKPIYSKQGDLSGQWHRGCFKCSYAGCPIQFNKDVTPYVLLDNAFCNHHYHTLNNTVCETCHSGIEGECIENELKQKWHLSCLKCTKCQDVISDDYYLINHQIVCEADASTVINELKNAGLTTQDKVEKRRTRMLFID